MMKDKEWLKEEIEKIDVEGSDNFPHYEVISKNVVLYAINQLDEPELLSHEWIDEKKVFLGQETDETDFGRPVYGVEEGDLLDLLVPKQEEVTEEAHEKYGMSETRWKEVIERYKWHLEQEGYAVIERPTVPQFVANWIETHKTSHSLYEVLWQAWNEDLDDHRLQKWIDNNSENHDEVFARAWLAYPNIEVEKEKKYRVEDDESPLLIKVKGKISRYNNTNYYGNIEHTYELTEQEIKDYDERYFAFAVPVEEMEE